MKIRNLIYLLLAGTVVISSCKKDFLTETPPTATPIADAIKTESDMADAVNGMYNAMRQTTLFGRDIPVLGDELADNAYIYGTNSGRYLTEMTYNIIPTNAEATNIWTQGYYAILQANRIIYAANQLPVTTVTSQLKGEAYTARALTYLELVNFFALPMTTNPTGDGVPLITAPTNIVGSSIKPTRAKTAAVYDKIISDLDSAYNLMTLPSIVLHPVNSNYIAKYAAKAIQARAYLYKGDYANARDAAQIVVTSGGYILSTSANYVAYWAGATAQTGKVETIFELALNTATNNGTNGLDYFYAQAGYGDLLGYADLYNMFSATDVRKNLFLTTSPTKTGTVYVNNKYSNVSNASEKDDIKIIRYSEVLLTLAEGYANTNADGTALTYLNQVAKQRDPSFVGYASTGAALKTDILNERRKELAFEGLRYFDLTRLALPVTRPVQAGTAPTTSTLAVTDYRRILPIPQAERDANPNISQNDIYK
jgi:hypothetical protein